MSKPGDVIEVSNPNQLPGVPEGRWRVTERKHVWNEEPLQIGNEAFIAVNVEAAKKAFAALRKVAEAFEFGGHGRRKGTIGEHLRFFLWLGIALAVEGLSRRGERR